MNLPRDPSPEMIAAGLAMDPLACDVPEDYITMIYTRIWQGMYDAAPAAAPAAPAPDRATNKTMPTLFQQVTGWLYDQQHKHDLGEWYTEKQINAMTNFELLQALSDALKEMENSK